MARTYCTECGGYMDAKVNEENSPVWECRCCWKQFPRKTRNATKKQIERRDLFQKMFDAVLFEEVAAN